MDDAAYYNRLNQLIQEQTPFVAVIMVDANGSVPQEIGAKMLVTKSGHDFGTVGGGKVETKAIEEAKLLLANGSSKTTQFVNWSLSRDVGMTCGGQVKLYFETYNHNQWQVTVFGAGHVANALINLLVKLECKIVCYDPRQEWLDKLPDSPKLTPVLSPDMPSRVAEVSDDSYVCLITMGHSTDKPILLEILRQNRKFPYLGVIGSDAKAARLYKDIEEAGLPASSREKFYCPMGLDFGSNHPQEIAISIIGQLLQQRDKLAIS
jgi:xanthine dehydrogenase accessory factor